MRGHRQQPGRPHQYRRGPLWPRGSRGEQVLPQAPRDVLQGLHPRPGPDRCRAGDAQYPALGQLQALGQRGQRDRNGVVGHCRQGRGRACVQAARRQNPRPSTGVQWRGALPHGGRPLARRLRGQHAAHDRTRRRSSASSSRASPSTAGGSPSRPNISTAPTKPVRSTPIAAP